MEKLLYVNGSQIGKKLSKCLTTDNEAFNAIGDVSAAYIHAAFNMMDYFNVTHHTLLTMVNDSGDSLLSLFSNIVFNAITQGKSVMSQYTVDESKVIAYPSTVYSCFNDAMLQYDISYMNADGKFIENFIQSYSSDDTEDVFGPEPLVTKAKLYHYLNTVPITACIANNSTTHGAARHLLSNALLENLTGSQQAAFRTALKLVATEGFHGKSYSYMNHKHVDTLIVYDLCVSQMYKRGLSILWALSQNDPAIAEFMSVVVNRQFSDLLSASTLNFSALIKAVKRTPHTFYIFMLLAMLEMVV